MKKLFVTLITIISFCSANLSHAADRYVTMLKDADGTTPLTQVIAADEVAIILRLHDQIHGSLGALSVTKGLFTFDVTLNVPARRGNNNYADMQPLVVSGPCTITYSPHSSGTGRTFITLKISPNPNIMGVKQ